MRPNKWLFMVKTVVAALLFVLTGCVRGQKTTASSISIAIPDSVRGLANGELEHLVINVSAPDIPSPIVVTWDGCKNCDVKPLPPSSFQVVVPQGKSRIVQVLTVYAQTEGGSVIYYGDNANSPLNLETQEASVPISVGPVTTATSLTSGMLSGRFLDTTRFPSGGPTGRLFVKYTPPGKPSMVLTKTAIFAGWFNAFGLKEVAFDYQLEDGTSLTGGPISLNDLQTSTSVIRIERPASISRAAFGDGNVMSNNREARVYYAGFFGPSAGTRRACYLDPARYSKVSGLFNSAGTTHLVYSAAAPSSANVAVSGGAVCSNADLLNSSSEEFQTYVAFRPSAMNAYNWGESPFGFYSVFKGEVTNNIEGQVLPFQVKRAANGYDSIIRFQLLPGVNSSILDGIRVLKRVLPVGAPGFRGDDNLPCDEMHSGLISGFSVASEMAIPSDTTGQTFSLNLPITSSEFGRTEFAVCPFRQGRHLGGVFLRKDNFSNQGGNGFPELHLNPGKMMTGFGTGAYHQETCAPLSIFETNATGPVIQSAPATVNFTSVSGGVVIKPNSDCTGTTLTSVDIPTGQSGTTVYMLLEGTSGTVSIAASRGTLAKTLELYLLPASPAPTTRTPTLTANVGSFDSLCADYDVVLADPYWGATVRPSPTPGPLTFTVSVSSANTAELRTDCTLTGNSASTRSASYTYSGASRNITDSYAQISLRTLDTSKETELKFVDDGTSQVTYAVLNSPVNNLFMGLKPKIWLRAGSQYFSTSLGGTLTGNTGWVSRVNGMEFTGSNAISLVTDSGYPAVSFGTSGSKVYQSGFGASSLNHGSMSGMILLRRAADGKILSLWNGSSAPASGGDGFSIEYTSETTLAASLGTSGLANTIAVPGVPAAGAAHVIAFKRVRSGSGPGSDTLSVSVNGSAWTQTTRSFTGAPSIEWIHLGDASTAFQGKVYEMVLFEGAPGDSQFQLVYNHWKAKYPNLSLP